MIDATCAVCTGPCPPPQRGNRPRRYCSERCRNRRPRQPKSEAAKQRGRERDRRRSRLDGRRTITQPCGWCGQPFDSRPVDKLKHCSRSCASKAQWQARRTWPSSRIYVYDCLVCGKPFTARRSKRRHCSRPCADRDYNQTRRPKRNPLRPFRCQGCGQQTIPRGTGQKRCEPCARRWRRINSRHRSRARKYGVAYEPINERAVFERDRWRCQLCRKPVAKTKQVPHPKAPTIDCIVPLSVPGSPGYVLSNVQLACFLCNSLKNNGSGGEQLRLVG